MKPKFKQTIDELFEMVGQHIKRHNTLLIVVLTGIILVNTAFTLGWYYSPDNVSQVTEIVFYIAQIVIFVITIAAIILIMFAKFGKLNNRFLVLANYAYAAFLIAWATVVFCFDVTLGFSPLTFLFVSTFVAGIFVIDPLFFAALQMIAMIPISITIATKHELFFGGKYFGENIALFVAYILLIIVICFRNYQVVHKNFVINKRLHEMSYKDELTGLLNERSYVEMTEEINHRIDSGEDVKFAVVLMDVNNLKVTNDAYGHRFGCSLIVRCGHTLPSLFKTSKLFHVGGDEFIVIVMGKDLENFEETMKRSDETLLYSLVEYEGKQLIFSVARGYHVREEGEYYKDVLQKADKLMYENKEYLKSTYNMKIR